MNPQVCVYLISLRRGRSGVCSKGRFVQDSYLERNLMRGMYREGGEFRGNRVIEMWNGIIRRRTMDQSNIYIYIFDCWNISSVD